MQIVRAVQAGESLEQLAEEARYLTFQTGAEHALIELTTGQQVPSLPIWSETHRPRKIV
jgi:hypothetical protein